MRKVFRIERIKPTPFKDAGSESIAVAEVLHASNTKVELSMIDPILLESTMGNSYESTEAFFNLFCDLPGEPPQ